jgi:hypothetical protein
VDSTPCPRLRNPALRRLCAAALALAFAAAAAPAAAQEAGADVVGGSPTSIEKWPWQVAIVAPRQNGGDAYERQHCGGALVSPLAVVTAAHCVRDDGFQSPRQVAVVAGRTRLSSSAGAEITAAGIFYFVDDAGVPTPQSSTEPAAGPELYSEASQHWDVAVIALSHPAPAPAAPIALASASERGLWEPGDPVYATGWGDTTGTGGNYPDTMREVALRVIADADCGDTASYGAAFEPETMLCAGTSGGGHDTCQGDSGGPLVAPAGDGSFRLVGITSFGDGCGIAEKWGVYARVADAPIQPALLAAIESANASAGTDDLRPPNTRLLRRPPRLSRKRFARFRWRATEPASFRCRFDGAAARPCRSPLRKRFAAGRSHTLLITATDVAGNVERHGLRIHWRVLARPPR